MTKSLADIAGHVFRIARCYRNEYVCVVLLGIMARGQGIFNPMYSIDGYRTAASRNAESSLGLFFSQGRFGLAGLLWITDHLGFFGIDIGVSSTILATLLFPLAGLFLGSLLRPKLNRLATFIFMACFVLHPYMTEFYHFSDVTFAFAFATLIAALGSLLFEGSTIEICYGLVMTILALSIYQTSIAFVLPVWLLRAALNQKEEGPLPLRIAIRFKGLIFCAFSIVFYSIIVRVIARWSHVPLDARTSPVSMLSIGEKIRDLGLALRLAFYPAGSLIAPFVITLTIGTLTLGVVAIMIRLCKTRGFFSVLNALVWIAVSLVVAAGLTSAGGLVWIVARTLTPVAAFEAGIFALGWQVASGPAKVILSALIALILIGFVGGSSRMLRDQWRTNLQDAQQVNRLMGRLEVMPGFDKIRTLVVSGTGSGRIFTATTWGDMNIPAIAVAESQIGLIEEAIGYSYAPPTTDDRATAVTYCRTAEKWPAPTSVSILGDIGVLCLKE